MLLSYFTEMPMSTFPEDAARVVHPDDHPARSAGDTVLLFSNRYFDPVSGSRLYQERFDSYRVAEEVGFDAVMTNEHHTAPFSMQARCNITSAYLAASTSRVKILQLGNPLPLWDNPVQIAEETAMIDMFCQGRLIAGIVRGGGQEQIANNVNPAYNREMFEEAHDLLIKAWTVPGPFRWEGEHYHVRVVNPWAVPLQKPHPRIFVPGVTSPETVQWAARHAYPYVCLNTTLEQTKQIWGIYDAAAAEAGFEAGPEHRGYLMRCHVADTEEKALEHAREFLWMRGEFTGVAHPIWNSPAGYTSWESRRARLRRIGFMRTTLQDQLDAGTIIAGTPDQVLPRIRIWLEETRPGTLIFWGNDGKIGHEESVRCIRLLGQEVLPAVRELGEELGLVGPFDVNAPVSLAAGPMVEPAPV
jgi:alkanesulfonate monooxygenase SsuD/methylene tetrahydromethanopterin reductase-like flavin-dependent oxidoreductase (luciferase family)